jgi:alpha-L-rhamnosidase
LGEVLAYFFLTKHTIEVTIPQNTTATVFVPALRQGSGQAKGEAGVTEAGKPAVKADGVKFMRMENGAALYAVGSGVYRFESVLQ